MLEWLIPIPKKTESQEGTQALPLCVASDVPAWNEYVSTFRAAFESIYQKKLSLGEGGVRLCKDTAIPAGHYRFDSREGLVLSASDDEGILYALATALQVIDLKDGAMVLPRVLIEDHPDKNYRALMVDLAREWHPAWTVDRYIDVCFWFKIKYLHLHFIDDERYTLPSRAFPKLTTEGEHYTLEQIAHMNEYAKARGVILIPELETPGHAASMVECYPDDFANHLSGGSTAELITEEGAVVSARNVMCGGGSHTMKAVEKLIDEIIEMFPDSPYIHIGGDEANIKVWNSCPDCIAYMKENGIEDEYELYSDFIGRVAQLVLDRGRTPIVWEGFPKKGAHRVPKETVVIAWESHYNMPEDLLAEGFKVINGSWQPLYITESFNHGRWSAKDIYDWDVYNLQHWWDHSAAKLNPIHIPPTDDVLGAQVTSWDCTYEMDICRVMECLAALSERTWNLNRTELIDQFHRRMRYNNRSLGRLIQDR